MKRNRMIDQIERNGKLGIYSGEGEMNNDGDEEMEEREAQSTSKPCAARRVCTNWQDEELSRQNEAGTARAHPRVEGAVRMSSCMSPWEQ